MTVDTLNPPGQHKWTILASWTRPTGGTIVRCFGVFNSIGDCSRALTALQDTELFREYTNFNAVPLFEWDGEGPLYQQPRRLRVRRLKKDNESVQG